MLRNAVPFVGFETVTRAILRERTHQAVARHLGDDRCRRDRDDQPSAADQPPRSRRAYRAGRGHRRTHVSAFPAAPALRAPAPTATRAKYCRGRSAPASRRPPQTTRWRKFPRTVPRGAPASAVWKSSMPLGIRLGSSTTAAAHHGTCQRTAPGLVATGHRPDAALDQRALAAKARRRDRDHALWQLGRLFVGFIPNHAGDRAASEPGGATGNSAQFPLFISPPLPERQGLTKNN